MKHYVVTRIYSDELKAWDIYIGNGDGSLGECGSPNIGEK